MNKIGVVLMMIMVLFGCSSDEVKSPVNLPHVHSVHLKSFSATDKTITFYVALFNSNDFPVAVSAVDGDITLNQLNIGKIDVNADYIIEGGAMKTVVVPIALDPDAFLKAGQTVLSQSKAEYQVDGGVKTAFGNVPFSGTGELPLQDILSTILR